MLSPIFRRVSRCSARLSAFVPSSAAPGCRFCPWGPAYHAGRCAGSPMRRRQVRPSLSSGAPFTRTLSAATSRLARTVSIFPTWRRSTACANLCVASIDATHDAKPLTHAIDRVIGWEYRWAFANRDHDADENRRAASVDIGDGAIVPLSPEGGVKLCAAAEPARLRRCRGRVQPVGDDFAGSSIRIATGRELVPGLPA
jgi:hypothetical protein